MSVSLLFQSYTLPCGVEIKNRFFKSAMSEGLATGEHAPSETLVRLYEKWANGGTGIVVTGNVMIDSEALGEPHNVVIENGMHFGALQRWAEYGTKNNTALWIQLNHPGKQSPKFLSSEPVAPSAIPLQGSLKKYFASPRELTKEDIRRIQNRFADAATVAKKAGFTGVQIHGAHGYLVSQFLSPLHNQRTDEYGGSLENRMRFLCEVYEQIRTVVGAQFPVGIKLNSADFQKGGFTEEESLLVIRKLCDVGIDLIELSGGSYENPAMMGANVKASTVEREAYFLQFAKQAKQIATCPIVVTGGFRSTKAMIDAIRKDETDFIGLARPLVLCPDLPNQVYEAKYDTMSLPKLKTGINRIDANAGMVETLWYEQQIRRLGQGKDVQNKNISLLGLVKLLTYTGTGLFRKRRA